MPMDEQKTFCVWLDSASARKVLWLHEEYQSRVPTPITISATMKLLLAEGIAKLVPAEVAARIEREVNVQKEKGGNHATETKGKPKLRRGLGGSGRASTPG